MTIEEVVEILKGAIKKPNTTDGYLGQALDMAIKALEQNPCEDCISRQAVEEMIKAEMPERGMWEIEGDKEKETVCEVCVDLMQKLSELPPVTPQQTRWIPVSERLPEKPNNYPYCGIYRTYFLVSLASGCVKTLGYEFDRDEWQVTGSPVIAWMPLPEQYVTDTNVGKIAESEASK